MSVSGPTGQNFEVLELLWRSGPAGVFPAQVQQERPRKHLFFGHLERCAQPGLCSPLDRVYTSTAPHWIISGIIISLSTNLSFL